MKRRHLLLNTAVLVLSATSVANAADRPDPKPYDRDRDGVLSTAELTVYRLHIANPLLVTFDKDFNGRIEGETEIAELNLSLTRFDGDDTAQLADVPGDGPIAVSSIPILPVEAEADPCDPAAQVFVRRDPMEVDAYSGDMGQEDEKGASLAISSENVSGFDATEIHGVVGVSFGRRCYTKPSGSAADALYLFSRSFAASVQADGVRTADDPDKDKSSVRIGLQGQLGWAGGLFDTQYLTFAPYYMTDFRGQASAYGAQAAWEPYLGRIRLNYSPIPISKTFNAYWEFRAEADWLHVDEVGRTDLDAGKDYAWLGGRLGATLYPWRDLLDSRAKVYGSWTYHRDVNQGLDARLYAVGAAYDLTDDGALSVSIDYADGLERDKLIEVERTTFSLNFKH